MEAVLANMLSPPILALAYAKGHYTIDTDGFYAQLGRTLFLQQRDRSKGQGGYRSRSLTKIGKAYNITK